MISNNSINSTESKFLLNFLLQEKLLLSPQTLLPQRKQFKKKIYRKERGILKTRRTKEKGWKIRKWTREKTTVCRKMEENVESKKWHKMSLWSLVWTQEILNCIKQYITLRVVLNVAVRILCVISLSLWQIVVILCNVTALKTVNPRKAKLLISLLHT